MVASVIIKQRQAKPEVSQHLEDNGIHPLLARLFATRGVEVTEQTDYRWGRLIHPTQLSDNKQAAILLADAIEQHKRILVVADYDCDGATACAVAICGLRAMGADDAPCVGPQQAAEIVVVDAAPPIRRQEVHLHPLQPV